MGRWCEIKCSCPNREPLPNSQWFDEPFRKEHKNKQRDEIIKLWRENTLDMYRCGHRNGLRLSTSPGDWLAIGEALDAVYKHDPNAFSVFRKIQDWRFYDDEQLSLPLDEVQIWKLEIEQLRDYLGQTSSVGWKELEAWNQYWGKHILLSANIQTTLEDALTASHLSIETNNPIEFFW